MGYKVENINIAVVSNAKRNIRDIRSLNIIFFVPCNKMIPPL